MQQRGCELLMETERQAENACPSLTSNEWGDVISGSASKLILRLNGTDTALFEKKVTLNYYYLK